jgi:hypothetical protein
MNELTASTGVGVPMRHCFSRDTQDKADSKISAISPNASVFERLQATPDCALVEWKARLVSIGVYFRRA